MHLKPTRVHVHKMCVYLYVMLAVSAENVNVKRCVIFRERYMRFFRVYI